MYSKSHECQEKTHRAARWREPEAERGASPGVPNFSKHNFGTGFNLPGQIANTFQFTVRDDSIVDLINKAQGQRVVLTYDQHKGIPTSCFGDTEYFVNGVRVIGP